MSSKAIEVHDIRKHYLLGSAGDAFPTLRDLIATRAKHWITRGRDSARSESVAPFWALDGVSFEIAPGEVVGLIGSNGAGKTTLLKILSRIVEPTAGHARLRGRVGSLLEVGTGFHPELTGRENIYLNGVIIGMSRREVAKHFDEIVAFAGIDAFLDTPVKRYSSGMYLRLAFAVAAHLEPEILLIDEVLAVGDAEFQKKCLGKIGEVARSGRTIVFVSHNLTSIQALCQRAIYLRHGKVAADGPARAVVGQYLSGGTTDRAERTWTDDTGPGTDEVRVRRACVKRLGGDADSAIDVRTPFAIEVDYTTRTAGHRVACDLLVVDEHGILLFNAGPLVPPAPLEPGVYRDVCRIPGDLMNDGAYRVEVRISESGREILPPTEILTFRIADNADFRHGWHGEWAGAIRPMLEWSTTRIDSSEA